MAKIFVVTLTALRDRATWDAHLPAHHAYLQTLKQEGVLLVAGHFGDQTSEMFLIQADAEATAEEVAQYAPLVREGSHTYAFREWVMTDGQPEAIAGLQQFTMPQVTVSPPVDLITVRAPTETRSLQNLPYFVGISAHTAGAQGISLSLIVVPPGAASKPHLHKGYETAIYILQGRVETRYGPGLQFSSINETGDFLFIPPDVPHQAINLSTTEPARAIVARNDPGEQERVMLYASADE